MESILRRLKFYGIGFGFGLMFLFFFFQNRGCSWLPGNRVKNAILDRVLVLSEEAKAEMSQNKISNKQIIQALNDGDILYSDSDKKEESKCYIIESNDVKFGFTLPVESFVSEVFIANDTNEFRVSKEGFGEFIHFPMDDHLVYIDTAKQVKCQKELLEVNGPKEILKLIKENGRINFDKTDFSIRPKVEHYIEFNKDSVQIKAKTIWYKDKLKIINFEFPGSESCKSDAVQVID